MLEHIAICGGDAELVAEGNDLPVGLVDIEDDVLLFGTESFAGKSLAVACDAVVGPDFSTHVEGLREHDADDAQVPGICVEGVDDAASDAVHGFGHLSGQECAVLRCHLLSLLQQGCQFRVCGKNLCRHLLHAFGQSGCGDALLQAANEGTSHLREGLLLFVAEDGHLLVGALVSTHEVDFRHVVGPCRLSVVVCLVAFESGNGHGLSLTQCHGAARVEGEGPRIGCADLGTGGKG